MSHDDAPDDETLAARIHQQDRYAFALLVGRYRHRAVSWFRHRTGNEQIADELTQDLFFKCWRQMPREVESFRGWFSCIRGRLLLMYFRGMNTDKRRAEVVSLDDERFEGEGTNPELPLLRCYLRQMVDRELTHLLDEDSLRALLLRSEDYSHAEIARALGISEGSARKKFERAKVVAQEALSRVDAIRPLRQRGGVS